jgi:hypothetical protein
VGALHQRVAAPNVAMNQKGVNGARCRTAIGEPRRIDALRTLRPLKCIVMVDRPRSGPVASSWWSG